MKLSPQLAKKLGVSSSPLERAFLAEWKRLNGPELIQEYVFHPTRKWRMDFVVLGYAKGKVAIELEGGIWNAGAHTRGKHFISDCEKYNSAASLGWRVFRLATGMVTPENVKQIIESL